MSLAGHDRGVREAAVCLLAAWPSMTAARWRLLRAELGDVGAADALLHDPAAVARALASLDGAASMLLASGIDRSAVQRRADDALRRMSSIGRSIWLPDDPGWTERFGIHPHQPCALFVEGALDVVTRPRVAMVGTRSASPAGRAMARRLGEELSDAGVAVISGLAYGIDAESHAGALASADASPIGVVGSGLDVVYPAPHRELWGRVAQRGLLVSEYLPDERPSPRTFPARNRIVAGLADVVVVVESTAGGGSMITAEEAQRWGRVLMAVPGNPLLPACEGSNRLLRERHGERPVLVCLETADVLSVLMLERATAASYTDPRPTPSAPAQQVLAVLGWEELDTARLVTRSAGSPSGVARALDELEDGGWVERAGSGWRQRAHHAPARRTRTRRR